VAMRVLTDEELARVGRRYRLTPRELELVGLILEGADSNRQIAERMGVSLLTSKNRLVSVYRKTRTSSKLELALKIVSFGLSSR
jgi:DNA-binding CsgD family transcriptional regulator